MKKTAAVHILVEDHYVIIRIHQSYLNLV